MTYALTIVFILVSILMILVVLVQKGRGGGLSGAFGAGGGGSTTAFGTKTGDVFTTITVILFAVFLLLAIWLNYRYEGTGMRAATQPTIGLPTTAPGTGGGTGGTPIDLGGLNLDTPPASQPK